MPLLKDEAAKLSNNLLIQGVIEEVITEDDLWAVLPFKQVNSLAYVYNRERELSEPDFLGVNENVSEGGAKFEKVTAYLRALIGDVDVDKFIQHTMGDTNDQKAIQIAKKSKALSRKWRRTLINGSAYAATWAGAPAGFILATEVSDANGPGSGTLEIDIAPTLKVRYAAPGDAAGAWVEAAADGRFIVRSANPARYLILTLDVSEKGAADATATATIAESKEFTGMKYLVDPAQTISMGTDGGDLSFEKLDELLDAVKVGNEKVLIMPSRTIRSYKALLRNAGGIEPAMIMIPQFGKPMLTYNGVPILKNDYIPVDEAQGNGTGLTHVYAAFLDEEEGVTGLAGGPNAGFAVEDVGTVQNKDADRTRVKQYGGLAVHSTLSLAKLAGVKN